MNIKGHIGFGTLCLIPIIKGNTIPYINNFNDQFIYYFNLLIKHFNDNLEVLHLYFSLKYFSFTSLILLFIYFYGVFFPDIDLKIGNFLFSKENSQKENLNKRYLYHRQLTHSLLLSFIGMYIHNIYIFIFSFGIFSHILADMITGSVPIFLTGHYYPTLNFFKWRIGLDSIYIYGIKSLKEPIKNLKNFVVIISDKLYLLMIISTIIIVLY